MCVSDASCRPVSCAAPWSPYGRGVLLLAACAICAEPASHERFKPRSEIDYKVKSKK